MMLDGKSFWIPGSVLQKLVMYIHEETKIEDEFFRLTNPPMSIQLDVQRHQVEREEIIEMLERLQEAVDEN